MLRVTQCSFSEAKRISYAYLKSKIISVRKSDYHEEWEQLVEEKSLTFFHNIANDIASKNDLFYRCNETGLNSGLCNQIKEYENYIHNDEDPPNRKYELYSETSYVFWLLGDRLGDDYEDLPQDRIKASFKGTAYYNEGYTGFRQMEFELHKIARLIEEDLDFEDLSGDGRPDSRVVTDSTEFALEVKMPTSNLEKSLSKALKQLKNEATDSQLGQAVAIGVDYLMKEENFDPQVFRSLCMDTYQLVESEPVTVLLEHTGKRLRRSEICHFAGKGAKDDVEDVLRLAYAGE